ncbi:MAG: hypothetical protein K6T92_07150 [Candidatus Rokubacteria bacterium]|nr:hypothetical protein [Candidatus Rokubacteria bacterium]
MIFVWCARVAWVSLPLTTGDALADAIGIRATLALTGAFAIASITLLQLGAHLIGAVEDMHRRRATQPALLDERVTQPAPRPVTGRPADAGPPSGA